MTLDLDEQEKRMILDLIANEEIQAIRSVDHSDTRDFTHILRTRLDLLASLKAKIKGAGHCAHPGTAGPSDSRSDSPN